MHLRVLIGFDEREAVAAQVCEHSLESRSSAPIEVGFLIEADLIKRGIYARPFTFDGAQRVDDRDGRPYSTAFAFTRFLVPLLAGYTGTVLFCDCDFLFTADPYELFRLADPKFAVQVVQQIHTPRDTIKMDGVSQGPYPRKNWSSLILWNCGHPANRALTGDVVSTKPGRWLHAFSWLEDAQIGRLPPLWNHLVGISPPPLRHITPKGIHFTRGGPWHDEYKSTPYADLWRAELENLNRRVRHIA